MITLRTKKRILILFTLIIWGMAGGVLWWGFNPLPKENNDNTNHAKTVKSALDHGVTSPREFSQKDFEKYWSIALRRELYDPPKPVPKIVKKPPPKPINITLLATTIEEDESIAWIKTSKGKLEKRKKGDVVDANHQNAIIFQINEDSIIIKRGEEEIKKSIKQ